MAKNQKQINKRVMYKTAEYEVKKVLKKNGKIVLGKISYYKSKIRYVKDKETKEFVKHSKKDFLINYKYILTTGNSIIISSNDYKFADNKFKVLSISFNNTVKIDKSKENYRFLKNYKYAMILYDHQNNGKILTFVSNSEKSLDDLYYKRYYNDFRKLERVLNGLTANIFEPIFKNKQLLNTFTPNKLTYKGVIGI